MALSKVLYTVPEICEATGLGRSLVYELLAAGRIESVHVGRRRLVPAEAVERFVAELRQDAADRVAS